MPVDVGDTLGISTCSQVRKGWLLRQYAHDGRLLARGIDQGDDGTGHLPRWTGADGDGYDDMRLCDTEGGTLFIPGKMLRLKVKLNSKCPFFAHAGIAWAATASFFEYEVVAESNEPTGEENSSDSAGSGTLTPGAPTASFSGPGGGASATIDVVIDDPDPEDPDALTTITITATFNSFDRTVEGEVAGETPRVFDVACGILTGGGGSADWNANSVITGVTRWIMSVNITFTFGDYFD